MKIKINDTVRILKYPKHDINAYGRVNGISKGLPVKFHIVNMNMPFSGTISGWFLKSEIALVLTKKERSKE